ncbi:universal stress protein [Halobium salinum]|uniref:Universal stress protein n=1 Tax=Halobium salinum TaxID=1364940 RepID=A0ABD5PIK0_9EURY|nr:universal stress protein [Halobium salinum]
MYDVILFPTDGSEESFAALEHALDIADTYGATLHVLYVVDTSYSYVGSDGIPIDWDAVLDAFRSAGKRALETAETWADREGVPVVGSIREDSIVHRAILQYVGDNDVKMIVMGTHGRRGLDRLLLGSVTERVLRTADVPVLTVRTAGANAG